MTYVSGNWSYVSPVSNASISICDEREEGRQEGQERMSQLILLLLKQNRNEDIAKAAADRDYQEQLFKEFNL